MTWQERVTTDFVILCGGELSEDSNGTLTVGDGVKAFKPLWFKPSKGIEYNTVELVFGAVKGSLVKRGTPRGTQYNLEFAFQGADHIDVAREFELKAGYYDPRTGIAPPWKITHPYYNTMYVQPISMSIDNTDFNTSVIRASVIETIKDNGQAFQPGADPAVKITEKAATVNSGYVKTYAADVPDTQITDIQSIRNTVNGAFARVSAMMNGVQRDVDQYLDVYNDVNGLLNNTIFNTQLLIMQTQTLLGMPAYFADTLANRMKMFTVQAILINREMERIAGLPDRTARSLKRLYETTMGAIVTGMALATVNGITDDYDYRPNVLSFVQTLLSTYNTYLTNLYQMQSLNGGMLYGWLPSATNISQVNILVNQAVSNLFNVAGRAKQQRIKTLVYDSNMLLLANELYGMKQDDSTIITLKKNNNWSLKQRWRIPAGTEVIYYV